MAQSNSGPSPRVRGAVASDLNAIVEATRSSGM